METQKTLIMQDGREAFYDVVLRYKNPYDGDSANFWFQGWDAACEEHKLFTANQDLCLKNATLTSQAEELKKVIERQAKSILGRTEDIQSIIVSIEMGNFITFSREKIRVALKGLVSRG